MNSNSDSNPVWFSTKIKTTELKNKMKGKPQNDNGRFVIMVPHHASSLQETTIYLPRADLLKWKSETSNLFFNNYLHYIKFLFCSSVIDKA